MLPRRVLFFTFFKFSYIFFIYFYIFLLLLFFVKIVIMTISPSQSVKTVSKESKNFSTSASLRLFMSIAAIPSSTMIILRLSPSLGVNDVSDEPPAPPFIHRAVGKLLRNTRERKDRKRPGEVTVRQLSR